MCYVGGRTDRRCRNFIYFTFQYSKIPQIAQHLGCLTALRGSGRRFSFAFGRFGCLTFHFRLQVFHLRPCGLGFLLLRLGFFDLTYGSLYRSVSLLQQFSRFLPRVLQYIPFLCFRSGQTRFVFGYLGFQVFFSLPHLLPFALPIAFIPCYILQLAVIVDMLLSHQFCRIGNNGFA